MVGHDFKMYEQRVIGLRMDFFEEKIEDASSGFGFEIERAINEFECPRAALIQFVHLIQKWFERERPRGFVQTG